MAIATSRTPRRFKLATGRLPSSVHHRKQLALNTLFAAAFAGAYLGLIWSLVPLESWPDITRYIARFGGLDPYTPVDTSSVVGWLTSEAGWAWWVNSWLSYGYSIDQVLQFSSAVALFLSTLALIIKTRKWWIAVLLLNPGTISLFVAQTRSALALSLVLMAIAQFRLRYVLAVSAVASTIHTSMPLMLPPYLMTNISRFRPTRTVAISLLFSIALIAVLYQSTILSSIGDRRAELDTGTQTGALFAVAWLIITAIYLIYSNKRISYYGCAYILMISFFEISTYFGLYSSRYASYAAVIIPYIIYTDISSRQGRVVFTATYATYSAIYFWFWLPQLSY